MNEFQIQLTSSQLSDLNNAVDMKRLLTSLFHPGSKNFDILAYEIQLEFKTGGSPQITQMYFDRVYFNNEHTGQGKFRIVLDINFTFGCEDVKTEKQDQTSEWTFKINENSKTITFNSSPFAESRSPADEL